VTAATHFFQLERVHDLALRRFVNVFFGQINHLLSVHVTSHFQPSHFAEIVFVFVGNDVAAGETFDRDDHYLMGWIGLDMDSDYYIKPLFLNQFLKIMEKLPISFIFIFVSS
jgi:hypothetical protein